MYYLEIHQGKYKDWENDDLAKHIIAMVESAPPVQIELNENLVAQFAQKSRSKKTPEIAIKPGQETITIPLIDLMKMRANSVAVEGVIRAAAGRQEKLAHYNIDGVRTAILMDRIPEFKEAAEALFGKVSKLVFKYADMVEKRGVGIEAAEFVADFLPSFYARIVKYDQVNKFTTYLGDMTKGLIGSFSSNLIRDKKRHPTAWTNLVSNMRDVVGETAGKLSFLDETGYEAELRGRAVGMSSQERSPYQVVSENESDYRLEQALGKLTDKQRQVLELRGFFGGEERPLKEIIAKLGGISKEAVNQIKTRALNTLRKELLKYHDQEGWTGYVTDDQKPGEPTPPRLPAALIWAITRFNSPCDA